MVDVACKPDFEQMLFSKKQPTVKAFLMLPINENINGLDL